MPVGLGSCVVCAAESAGRPPQDKANVAEILEPLLAQPISEFKETPAEREARMAWWRESRFGLFVSWGPVSLTGKEIGWSRGGERRDGSGVGGPIPAEIYDNLYKHFNPSVFDANEWARIAKDAGAKYIVFITKHHDGFCMWDTQTTDYKITSAQSPFGRDVARELADACHAAGIKLIWYFSLGDWYDPDYYSDNHDRFTARLLGQIRELCTNYGRIEGFWFDLWYAKMAEEDLSRKVNDLIHQLQPGAVINNRGGLSADYDTPEQRIGAFQTDRPWETCMTIGTQWAWKSKETIKSFDDCIYILVNTAGGDGNLLLNVGPMPDGRIAPKQVKRLEEIGSWMKKYGQSIYGTRGGPFMPGDSGASTHKDNRVYLHVLEWDGQSLSLPPIDKRIVSASLLTGGEVAVKQSADGITITVDAQHRQSPDTIVVLELDGPAGNIAPVLTASGTLAFRKPAEASSVFENDAAFGAARAFDGDAETCWTSETGIRGAWLEVDLGQVRTVAQAVIGEAKPGRIKQFEIQCKAVGDWTTVYSGLELGAQAVVRFKPIGARYVRLNILQLNDCASIGEFKLTGPVVASAQEYTTRGSVASDEAWSTCMERWAKVGASQVHGNLRQYGPDKLLDGKRWIAGNCDTAWLDIDFGRERTVNQAVIYTNRYWQKVERFELRRPQDGQWRTFYSNAALGTGTLTFRFKAVTLRHVRMKITMKGTAYIEAYKLELSHVDEAAE